MHGLRYQKFGWLWGVVGLSVGLSVLGLVTAALAEPGLVGQYYGNRDFWYHGGQLELPSLEVAQDLNRLKWPAPNWDASKGPLFQRGGGWSLAVYGALEIEQAGSYRFFAEGPEAQLWLGERQVTLDGTRPVALEAGEVPLRLYLRSDSPLPDWQLNFRLRWQRPGQGEAEAIPGEAWSHHAADRERTRVFEPEFPLESHQVRFFHRRDYEVTLPADGFYEIVGHFPSVPRQIEVTLDGQFLYHHLGRSHLDPAGPSDYGFDLLNRARVVRYLTRGRHTITVGGYQGNYPFEQKSVENFFQQSRWGVSRVPAGDPAASRSLYLPAREDLVFRRGEPLVVRVEQATQEAAEYQLEVVRQRGEGPAAVSARTQLPAGQARAVGELRYPCAEEGAFECVVRDAQGAVVAGPWAFVVVDPTPLPRPGPSAELPELRRVRVDQVDCTQPEDREHRLRDNGTSRVVQGPAGAYRVTGDRPKRQAYYKMKQPLPGLIPLEQAEPGAAHYDVMDWFAYTLRVEHPGRPHVVTAYVPNDVPRLVSVWGYDQVTGQYNAAALEAGNAPASPAFSPVSFLMWPNGEAVDVLVFCDASPSRQEPFSRQGAVARLELYELPEGLPPLPAPVGGFVAEREFGWAGEQVNLGMEQRMMPALWPEGEKVPGVVDRFQWHEGAYMDWKALATTWERFGELSRWRGDRLVVWPVNSYSMGRLGELEYMERDFESYTRSYRARLVDPRRRDQFKLMLLLAEKYGVKLVADFQMSRWYDFVLLATDTEGRYGAEGLFVTDANGKNVNYPAQILNPAHPLSREYMVRWAEEIGRRYGGYPAFAGIGMRQGGWHTNNSGFFYSRNFGYDDFTVGLFEQETGHQIPVKATGEERFGQRREYLLGELEEEWLRWRCEKCTSLREALLEALRQHAPQARLYSSHGGVREDFFDLRSGSGIAPELRGRRELGYGEVLRVAGPHIENGALDPVGFANFDVREPAELRRTLETALGNRGHEYPSNPCAGAGSTLRPHPYQLEPLARALAEGELETVLYGGPWILPAVDEGLRAWAQAWQAIPELEYLRYENPANDQPLVCWQARQGGALVLYLVNVTPYTQRATVTFAGQAGRLADLVSGATVGHGNTANVTVGAYMVLPLRVLGAEGVAGIQALPEPQRLAQLEAQVRFLQGLAPRAQGFTHVVSGAGEQYVTVKIAQEQYDDGPWGRRDVQETFDDLLQPILAAWKTGDYTQTDQLLTELAREHSWWYEALGWPPGEYRPRLPSGPYAEARELEAALTSPEPNSLGSHPLVPGESLSLPAGSASLREKMDAAGKYELVLWMVTGAGYGPVEVEVDGKASGQLGVGEGEPYFGHFTLLSPLPLLPGEHTLTLKGQGARSLVLSALELRLLPPEPIKRWSVIGLFDKGGTRDGWDGFDTVFPPEQEIDLQASYEGLGGQPARWQQIDLGEDKFIQLLERYFPYDYTKGNGVAYLATWVYSPEERNALLYYAFDWYSRIWVNDEVVVQQGSGPWRAFATVPVHLRAGWNKLLAKTSCGRSSWKANLALSDPGDLRYSPVPPS